MTPRSTRLAGPVSITVAQNDVLLYTVPAAKVALIKSIRVVNQAGSATFVRVGVGGTAVAQLVLNKTVSGDDTYVDPDTDPIVLAAGETVHARLPVAAQGPATFTLSGALLSA